MPRRVLDGAKTLLSQRSDRVRRPSLRAVCQVCAEFDRQQRSHAQCATGSRFALSAARVKTTFDSCSINLSPAADPADGLQMVVIEAANQMKGQVPHMLTPTAGWTITPDGKHVEITGDLCSDAMAGRFLSISFEYKCKDDPPIPVISPS
jgi:hypothetical protein